MKKKICSLFNDIVKIADAVNPISTVDGKIQLTYYDLGFEPRMDFKTVI